MLHNMVYWLIGMALGIHVPTVTHSDRSHDDGDSDDGDGGDHRNRNNDDGGSPCNVG